jgi:ABC-2 type transport system permease protein
MIPLFNLIRIEMRREWLLSKSYWVELIADQVFFILGFLVLTGLFEVATRGQYAGTAQMAALIGYLVWRVAGGCMADVTHSVEEDAQWGTLEQVWLSGAKLGEVVLARSGSLIFYYSLRVLIIAVITGLILRLPLTFTAAEVPAAILLYGLTLISPLGLAFLLAGLHLAFKNISAITQPLATILLFLTGALTPLDGIPVLYPLSRVLPLSIGIDLLRDLLVEGVSLSHILASRLFVALLINSVVYLGAGLLVLSWARQKVLADGSLAHY